MRTTTRPKKGSLEWRTLSPETEAELKRRIDGQEFERGRDHSHREIAVNSPRGKVILTYHSTRYCSDDCRLFRIGRFEHPRESALYIVGPGESGGTIAFLKEGLFAFDLLKDLQEMEVSLLLRGDSPEPHLIAQLVRTAEYARIYAGHLRRLSRSFGPSHVRDNATREIQTLQAIAEQEQALRDGTLNRERLAPLIYLGRELLPTARERSC